MASGALYIDRLYSLELNQEEFEGVKLAVELLIDNDLTHPLWKEILEPVIRVINEIYDDEVLDEL